MYKQDLALNNLWWLLVADQPTNLRSSHAKDSKMVLDAALSNIMHNKIRIKIKVRQTREWSSILFYTSV